ncbi:cleavage stimulation factor subunit 3 [Elysia marginata]|uniref:Cleavage stimulation factor subunit 3 n=1 Tax=Elysia marginata TaxID=1093978 RepID=A0AAV4J6G5_9GAST|nr:cleavage stimulation factor subunit 3 [Elysia marginata]
MTTKWPSVSAVDKAALPGSVKPLVPEEQGSGYIPDKIVKAEKRIQAYPFDTEAWSILIRDAQLKKIEEARGTYERLVEQFPNAGKYWKIYIEHELRVKNFERVEKAYVAVTASSISLSFCTCREAVGSYAENQRITAVRKVYQRGVTNPMINIELLWKDYNAYETSINSLIAKKLIDDRSREYMSARRVAKEYEVATRGLDKNNPSVPPQNTYTETKQVELWKKYIAWEKKNPLRSEDQTVVTKRGKFNEIDFLALCL